MFRWLIIYTTFYLILFLSVDAAKKRAYSTGIADLVRTAFRQSFSRFVSRQTSYDSDVFRYTQLSQRGVGGLFVNPVVYQQQFARMMNNVVLVVVYVVDGQSWEKNVVFENVFKFISSVVTTKIPCS
ncbi:unnamed protein product [Adineta ricciae]|uniref:Uncharacterized protein n=1 Tax=Adineta ricciae TaxID=249248 RepID=A0A814CV88_ADIRI|nr:unnamed protein product [Adineta ricciae]